MFGWRFLDASGQEIGRSPRFPDDAAAEEWIGASWRDLRERGVDEVVLYDHDRDDRVYRMGLDDE